MSGAGRRGRKAPEVTDICGEFVNEESGSFYHQPFLFEKEQWYDAWSDELVTTYHILIDHCSSQGLPFLENLSFHDFINIAHQYSSKRPPT